MKSTNSNLSIYFNTCLALLKYLKANINSTLPVSEIELFKELFPVAPFRFKSSSVNDEFKSAGAIVVDWSSARMIGFVIILFDGVSKVLRSAFEVWDDDDNDEILNMKSFLSKILWNSV